MPTRSDIQQFLTSRRARINPEQAGLPISGNRRRVPGLRREEVAMLAGVSVDYYHRLERGNLKGVSDGVLNAVCDALQLHGGERAHLFYLARATTAPRHPAPEPVADHVRPNVQRILSAVTGLPAFVRNIRLDFLAANQLGYAFHTDLFAESRRPVNGARFTFLNPQARVFYTDWEGSADDVVATLRTEAGRHPHDQSLLELISELTNDSAEFATRWTVHDVRHQSTGFKRMHHPVVGDLEMTYEELELPSDPGHTLFAFLPEPDSPSAEALERLARTVGVS